jgi:hypothetical protein
MTISIMLGKKPYTSPAKRFVAKCELTNSVHEWLGVYFEARRIEEWQNATDESLGGKLLNQYQVETPANVAPTLRQIAHQHENHVGLDLPVIVAIRGVWVVDEPIGGYITMSNHEEWRDAYGDIEIGLLASDAVTDVVELIWKSEVTRESLVTNFLRKFSGFENDFFDVESIVFALGVPSSVSVSEWLASHYKNPSYYFMRVLTSMEEESPEIRTYIRLINRLALTTDLYRIEDFRRYIKQVAKKTDVAADYRSSIQLIGRNLSSYKHLYEELSASLAQVLKNSLPRDKEIDGKLERESARLSGSSTLDQSFP